MAGERSFNPGLGGLGGADLSYHDKVWVLAQERTEGRGERKADIFINMNLIDTREVKFYRILGGRNVRGDLVQFGESRVQGRGFARPRRPGNQHHSIGSIDPFLKVPQRPFFES